MAYIYIIYSLILYVLFKIIKIISTYFLISPELYKIPSLPLIISIKLNVGNYLLGVPFVTNIRNFLLEPLEETGIVKYFDILWQRWIIFVAEPKLLKEINLRSDLFQKIDASNRPMSDCEFAYIGRKNILFENKEEHLRHRRIANPSFHHIWPTELFGDIIKELFKELDKDFKVNNTINIQDMTQSFTLEALGKAAFDYNFGAVQKSHTELIKAHNETMRGISNMNYVMFPVLEKIPGFKRTHLFHNIKILNNVILNIINKRKQKQQTLENNNNNINLTSMNNSDDNYIKNNIVLTSKISEKHNDLLSYMLKAEADETNLKKRLSTEELLNDLKVFLIAGHDSTAAAISAAIHYLGKNPECQKKVREEVISIIGDKKDDVIPTLEQIKEMKYINMVINETLRIHPPAPALNARIAQKDTKLGEYVILKGQMIIPNIYALHHSKKIWGDEPYKFKPERFEKETLKSSYNFIPFGGGVRICIGMNFSLAEQRVFLAMFVKKYQWTIPKETIHNDKIEVNKTYLSLLVPRNLYATFKRRY
ncbi:hypothetical protein Glove_208g201 [Diversispora epigaea]|uniref:Cytochrome P450 n=1 Tax=Diversispora epigaea TaxID=1348612 RepID=A0A397IIX6_9GLOM|nr:hypothetical protein Glove_208g201 [Diversispora epigaea]